MKTLTRFSNTLMERYLPDPYIFVAILTLLVFLLGVGLTDSSPLNMVVYWGDGFWGLLAFTMQMVIVLVAGHVLASSPIFKKLLSTMASGAKSPGSAILLVTF
ncbi:MAG: TIGR00366 family protein, partial [Bacilli bacterium]|nr:TIGR00366 family protein [Bacilli bacterium]